MKMPEPTDVDVSQCTSRMDSLSATEIVRTHACVFAVMADNWPLPPIPRPAVKRQPATGTRQEPQENLVWTTYDDSAVTPENPYARPVTFYGPQPPANVPRPVMWWAAPPRPDLPPYPYNAHQSGPYRKQ